MDPLRKILPACVGRAVDARALRDLLDGDDVLDRRLQAYVNLFFTRFDGRIDGGARALSVAGGQVGALVALLHAVAGYLEDHHSRQAASLLWNDALATGCAARALAEVDRAADPDLAFAVATCRGLAPAIQLMDDPAGQLTWWRSVRRARGLRRKAAAEPLMGTDPELAVVHVLDELGVPDTLLDLIAGDTPEALPEGWLRVHEVSLLAAELAEALGSADAGPALQGWVTRAAAAAGVSPGGAWELVEAVVDTTPRIARALELPELAAPDLSTLRHLKGRIERIEEASDLAILANLQAAALEACEARIGALEEALTTRQLTDPVTDLPNLQTLCSRLASELSDPACEVRTLAILDIVDFGTLFARFGIRATDRLLARIARSLDRVFPETDLLGRTGPATFVVALPDSERMTHLRLDRARAAIADTIHQALPGAARPQIDVGVLDLADIPLDIRSEALVEAARRTLAPAEVWARGA